MLPGSLPWRISRLADSGWIPSRCPTSVLPKTSSTVTVMTVYAFERTCCRLRLPTSPRPRLIPSPRWIPPTASTPTRVRLGVCRSAPPIPLILAMVPLAATPRSVATGHQDVASPDSTLELRLLRRSARTGTQAPSRDLAHAAGAEATPKRRVRRAAWTHRFGQSKMGCLDPGAGEIGRGRSKRESFGTGACSRIYAE